MFFRIYTSKSSIWSFGARLELFRFWTVTRKQLSFLGRSQHMVFLIHLGRCSVAQVIEFLCGYNTTTLQVESSSSYSMLVSGPIRKSYICSPAAWLRLFSFVTVTMRQLSISGWAFIDNHPLVVLEPDSDCSDSQRLQYDNYPFYVGLILLHVH